MTDRLPVYERVSGPPGMRLTERDRHLLETMASYDGILADYQIARLFFKPGTNPRTIRDRLMLLYQHGYVERPTRQQRARLSCMVYFLGREGQEYLAALRGDGRPAHVKPPQWPLVEHNLAVNDFRIAVVLACDGDRAQVEEWVPSHEFWAYPDTVQFELEGRSATRAMRPDGYFSLVHREGERRVRSRMLLELDRGTEDNPRFVREKVFPGLAYLRSEAYRIRFSSNSGRWLVVTTSERRLANMKRQIEAAVASEAALFYFTTLERVKAGNVLFDPIWMRPGVNQPGALLGAQAFSAGRPE